MAFRKSIFPTEKVSAATLLLVAPRHIFVARCRKVGGRARAVARPRLRGRTATEARACDRPCAADKRKAWRGGRVALCDGDALSRVKKMLAFFVWEKSWP